MFAHRFRREDQNEVRGLPLDRWSPWYPFPTEAVGIRNARFLAVDHGWEVQLETGEQLSKRGVVRMPLVKEKALNGRLMGSRDPWMLGKILIPITRQHHTLPKVKDVPPDTFYRYNEKRQRVECLVTVLPNGLHVAWDSCGQCAAHIKACHCTVIRPSRSVVHLYEIATGETFVKPTYEKKDPVFELRKPLLTKRASPANDRQPIEGLSKVPLTKTPLTKKPLAKSSAVEITQQTSISDFDSAAAETSKLKKEALLKSLKRPALTKKAPLRKA